MSRLSKPAILAALFGASAAAQETLAYRPGIDVLDYAFVITLPDTGSHIRGDAMLTFRRTDPVDTLVLDLRDLRVTRVMVDDRVLRFRRTDSTIHIPLPRGDTGTFRAHVAYNGRVTDGLIARRDSAGRWTYFGDNWPNRARFWLPTVDHPSDKATVTWSVNAPANRTVVANGSRFQRTLSGSGVRARATTRWRESMPIPTYLMVIAAAPLVAHDLGQTACGLAAIGRCVPQQVYTAPEQRRTVPGDFARAGEMLRAFASWVAPYPYEKLAHLQSSTRFGGMENASAIFYSDAAFRRGGVGEGLIAHETAHQWFGNSATAREWPHLWLSEGFATYWAALWTRHARGDSAFRAAMADIRDAILRDTNAVTTRPVIDTAETELMRLLNANSYQKGGFVLHMLREDLGDSAFFQGVRDYYNRHKHATAVTSDLQDALERSSGRDLDLFFDQWLRRPGYPELDIAWKSDSTARTLALTVIQGDRFGAYQLNLRLALADTSGEQRFVEIGIPVQDTTKVELPISAPVTQLEVDPAVQLLARFTVRQATNVSARPDPNDQW
jgi:aminopeptidase N